ncbi:MAG TPA: hypothetical protein VGQ71_11795, partial [Terriglobales bacterium]|nr:hypothetical protein [Terriglobales bacterium]
MNRRSVPLLAALVCLSLAGLAYAADTAVKNSYDKARKVLDAGVQAVGGPEALQQIENVSFKMRGTFSPRLQMDTPEPPFNIGSREESTTLDLKNGRIMSEQKGSGAGFAFWNRALAKGSEAWNIDLRNRIVTPGPPGSTTQPVYQQYYRRMPALILRTALDRALTLRWVGEDNFRGRKHNVITYAQTDGNQVALYFDAQSNLLSKYELLFIDALNGEDVSEIEFADYQTFGPLKFPTVWRNRLAGDTASDMKVSDVAVNTKLDDKAFEIPEGLEKAPTPPQGQPITVSRLADDVVLVRDTGGGNYNVLAVGFKDHILVVEAPQNSGATEAALARIKEALPAKPIKYVA